ncbi:hypothetical protein AVEN_172991-1, partial [Araneus ventricosus]
SIRNYTSILFFLMDTFQTNTIRTADLTMSNNKTIAPNVRISFSVTARNNGTFSRPYNPDIYPEHVACGYGLRREATRNDNNTAVT